LTNQRRSTSALTAGYLARVCIAIRASILLAGGNRNDSPTRCGLSAGHRHGERPKQKTCAGIKLGATEHVLFCSFVLVRVTLFEIRRCLNSSHDNAEVKPRTDQSGAARTILPRFHSVCSSTNQRRSTSALTTGYLARVCTAYRRPYCWRPATRRPKRFSNPLRYLCRRPRRNETEIRTCAGSQPSTTEHVLFSSFVFVRLTSPDAPTLPQK